MAGSLFAEMRVRDDEIVRARLAQPDYLPLIASATAHSGVSVARPEGVGRALTTCRIPIEGREEWEAAARVRSA